LDILAIDFELLIIYEVGPIIVVGNGALCIFTAVALFTVQRYIAGVFKVVCLDNESII
jgi:hypothetical protein